MTPFTSMVSDSSQRRLPVEGNRVTCRRLGSIELDRCRECLYLVALVDGAAPGSAVNSVVCLDSDLEAEVVFAS